MRLSSFIIPTIFGIVFADIAGLFSQTDLPFVLAFLLYLLFVFTQKSSSRVSFGFAMFFLIWMGLSYIPTGPSGVTERIGEWFFLSFVLGLLHYGYEVYRLRQ